MLPQNNPDRIRIAFDDHRLVANAGLLLPATLAWHLGLRELVDHHLDLGGAPGRANRGDKMLTLVASALAGGDCIDDADALRAGGTAGVLGCAVKAPYPTFLRSFRWGHDCFRRLYTGSCAALRCTGLYVLSSCCRVADLAGTGSGCQLGMLRAEAAISIQPLPVHLLDGPPAGLQALGQFPLARPLRQLQPDVLPLLLGQAGPSARETPLGPCLSLGGNRAVPDRVLPPLSEGEHHRELELAGGRGRVEVFPRDRNSTPARCRPSITCSP